MIRLALLLLGAGPLRRSWRGVRMPIFAALACAAFAGFAIFRRF
jgi:hypothetical protein